MKKLALFSVYLFLISCGNTGQGVATSPEEQPLQQNSASSDPDRNLVPAPVTSQQQKADLSKMIEVPEGEFTFGMEEEHLRHWLTAGNIYFQGIEEEYRKELIIPERRVGLEAFYIDRFETTNREYKEFVDETGYLPSDTTDYLNRKRNIP